MQTMDFLRGVLQGKKRLFKLDQIKIMDNIPRYPEIDLSEIWESVKVNESMRLYFPDNFLNHKKPPNRSFLFTVCLLGDINHLS